LTASELPGDARSSKRHVLAVTADHHGDRFGMTYAVAQDNDGATWRAYRNQYWPTLYLIDKQGRLRYRHIGEGAYDVTQAAIQALLEEPAS
jgi:hypothetical protein